MADIVTINADEHGSQKSECITDSTCTVKIYVKMLKNMFEKHAHCGSDSIMNHNT